jgi:elongation factor Ts
MGVSATQVKELRVATGAPILDCKKALENSEGDFDQAVDWLRKQGLSSVANKAGRDASEGLVDSYIHPGNRVGVIVEVNCETDFVAKTDDFRALVHDILLHIAMAKPLCIDKDDLPSESLSKEEQFFREQALKEGKPKDIVDKIVAGKLEKYYKQVCLLRQPFVKDEDQSIQDLVNNSIAKFGENVVVHKFARFELGK